MCSFGPSAPRTSPAPVYVMPKVEPAAPLPPTPAPAAPTPYYDQLADTNEKNTSNATRARVGRSALKINLVNSGDPTSGSALNTTN
jgi:hypothetical protein